jgi:isoleucyl-tRNA synthetase
VSGAARERGWSPSAADPAPASRSALDRWVLSELNALVREVDAAMERFEMNEAGRLLSQFVNDLSNWYVRRCRRRFWYGDAAALATLHEALTTVAIRN